MIQRERIQVLNAGSAQAGRYVLYWMQASQRAEYNHALEYAIGEANKLGLPVLVFFGLTGGVPGANARHYRFLLEGLCDVREALQRRGIAMIIRRIPPVEGVVALARRAALVVTDRGYLRYQRQWREAAAARIDCPFIQVESDVIVPVETASPKEEYGAATFRPKIKRLLDTFLVPLEERDTDCPAPDVEALLDEALPGEPVFADSATPLSSIVTALSVDASISPARGWRGGSKEAHRRLDDFLGKKLFRYHEDKKDPSLDGLSELSPFLHFGQISPLEVALKARQAVATDLSLDGTGLSLDGTGPSPVGVGPSPNPGLAAFLEELIVRRELAMNFAYYNPAYDQFAALPAWAQATLHSHRLDSREFNYTKAELENACTHDRYWNAAQTELVLRGKMHGYMRMYWGKKILEWTADPERAYRIAVELNDTYALDGRDPNGYTGIAWCFGKHDRPWGERAIFGKVRYMNAAGLRRKFDIEAYVRKVENLVEENEKNGKSGV
ncbi:deoxyribodipyrimidine photolyase [Heliomicrobium modesticaldum Ice1]|uniref:Deoxyribodipyrimidine photo-lyase n=1 Tax=Heliobacterium modesticaldum (strain ATCC 51547 / Ice1) TaxID=498761 RepID=B0TFA2_HELMI|nr:deoxyribodipyrimidine photo-lyase [Heliomicrobium modesticaldum]ABZ84419.1 deoxyribodipyrimidine photolyase [Heliomicrobium modesticaldum Ice1]